MKEMFACSNVLTSRLIFFTIVKEQYMIFFAALPQKSFCYETRQTGLPEFI